MDEIIRILQKYRKPAQRIVYYPSSVNRIKPIFDLDGDAFFFSDKWKNGNVFNFPTQYFSKHLIGIKFTFSNEQLIIFELNTKRGYFIFTDNNATLDIIKQIYGHLDIFIGVRDGCCEGGNYECVNNLPFIGKVVDLAPPSGMDIYIDHSDYLNEEIQEIDGRRISYLGNEIYKLSRSQLNPIMHYKVLPI